MFTKEELKNLRSAVIKLEFYYTRLFYEAGSETEKEFYNKQMQKMNSLGYKILELMN